MEYYWRQFKTSHVRVVKSLATGKNHTDIVCRIAQAEQAYYKKRNRFTSNTVSQGTGKSLLIKSFACSVALCAAETWQLN